MMRRQTILLALVGGLAAACSGEAPPNTVKGTDLPPESSAEAHETLMEAIESYAACTERSMEVFAKTGLYKLYLGTAMDPNPATCGGCHTPQAKGVCEGNSCIGAGFVTTFRSMTTFPGVMRLVTGTIDEEGNYSGLVPSWRYRDKGRMAKQFYDISMDQGLDKCFMPDGSSCHPYYDMEVDNPKLDKAITEFTNVTLERWQNDTCDAAYQVDEADIDVDL